MARLLLTTALQVTTSSGAKIALDSRVTAPPKTLLSPATIEARLRQPRSAAYLAALTQLDSGGHVCDSQAVQLFLATLREEFPDLAVENYPVGIVAKCYLGAPFEVHTFDFAVDVHPSNIVHHYKTFETLPAPLETARSLALNPSYAFVEVYTDKLVPVATTRTVSLVSLLSGGGGVAPY